MASTQTVLSPRAQTVAIVVFGVTLLLSIGISGYAPLVWFIALLATIGTWVVIGRRRDHGADVVRDSQDLNALMADGRPPVVIRDEAMAEVSKKNGNFLRTRCHGGRDVQPEVVAATGGEWKTAGSPG